MGGQCAICWGDMPGGSGGTTEPHPPTGGEVGGGGAGEAAGSATVAGPGAAAAGAAGSEVGGGGAAMALPCSHAFHRECLQQWLQQCYGQARSATCPMCQLSIPLRVRYRMPWHPHGQQAGGEEGGGGQQAAAEGIPGLAALAMVLQEDFRARFEPMLDVAPPEAAPAGGHADVAHADVAAQLWPPPEAVLLPPQMAGQAQAQAAHEQEQAGAAGGGGEGGAGDGEALGQHPQMQQQAQQQGQEPVPQLQQHGGPAAGIGGGAGPVAMQQLPVQVQPAIRRRGLLGLLLRRRRL